MRPPPDRDLLVDPPPSSWGELDLDDRLLRQPLLGETIAGWRDQLRQELARTADGLDPGRPWICVGHQPLPMHPGIWFKRWLADAVAARRGGQAVAVWLDLEPAGKIVWPGVREGRVEEVPLTFPPFWHLPITRADLRPLLRCLGRDDPELPARPGDHFPAWRGICALLRRWEQGRLPHLIEVAQSELFFGETMQQLFARMVEDPEQLHRCYNELLAAYRAERGLRSEANPFPDLNRRGELFELPFWVYRDEGRQTLYAPAPERNGPLVPKGALLATVKRLLLADLYLHGTGGGDYEPFSQRLLETCFGVRPPRFVVASASFGLDRGEHAELARRLREAKQLEQTFLHNPDRLVGQAGLGHDELVRALVEAKREATTQIARGPAHKKKALAAEIRRSNAALRRQLQPWWQEVAERHAALRLRLEQLAPLARRDLPVLHHAIGELTAAFCASLPSL